MESIFITGKSQPDRCSVLKHTNYVWKHRLQSVQMSFVVMVFAPLTLNSGAGVCMYMCLSMYADGCLGNLCECFFCVVGGLSCVWDRCIYTLIVRTFLK